MELLVLNPDLEAESIIDVYKSCIWTDRYAAYGDFEIYTQATISTLSQVKQDYYLWCKDSEHSMIVESIEITSDAEYGNTIVITGRSLESILTRRIVWATTNLKGSLQNGIKKLLTDAIIAPTEADRKIDNFVFITSTDAAITSLTVEKRIPMGANLYDTIVEICSVSKIGFKIVITDDGKFAFSLYAGTDRSYDQIDNPFVVFSPKFGNVITSNYLESNKNLKTVTLVAGEGDEDNRTTRKVTTQSGAGKGIARREMYTDVQYLSKNTSEGTLTDDEYNAQLDQRGKENLSEHETVKTFDGEVDTTQMFVYGVDFFMGDIVQVANEYGAESKSRVTEFIRSQDSSGAKAYPTFEIVE